VEQLERQLDGARLVLVALLTVITDEQFGSVKAALEAVDELSETCHAALEELSVSDSERHHLAWRASGR
jgi:hypothetical protein